MYFIEEYVANTDENSIIFRTINLATQASYLILVSVGAQKYLYTNDFFLISRFLRGDIKIQVLATARFCKSLQTLATTGLLTLSQVCQPLARSEKQNPFSRYPSNDILITLIAH